MIDEIRPSPEVVETTRQGIELWRPVPNADGWYDVSNLGRVRSWLRRRGRGSKPTRAAEPKVLVACPNRTKNPYLCVTVFVGKRRRYVPVHNLVCEAFIGPRPGRVLGWDAGHDDDDLTNNRLDNLKWCTRKANARDKETNGRVRLRPVREVNGITHYRCTACDQWKAETDFGRITGTNAKQSRCGVQPECRKCTNARRNELRRRKKATI